MKNQFPMIRYNNIPEMVINSKNRFYNKAAIRWIRKVDDKLQTISFNELVDCMTTIFYALNQMGFKKKDHMGICSKSSPEWIMTDLGIQTLGGVTVPIDPTLKRKEIKYILKDSECKAVFIDKLKSMKKIDSIISDLPELKLIVMFTSKKQSIKNSNVMSFDELLSLGEKQYYTSNKFNSSVSNINEDDVASIIYTPRTKEDPKGILLTHKNILSDAIASVSITMKFKKRVKPWKQHYFSVIPFSDLFGRILMISSLLIGATIDIINQLNPKVIEKSLEKFKPTIMVANPLVYQVIYNTIFKELEQYSEKQRKLVNDVIENGELYYTNKRNDIKIKLKVKLRHKILAKIVGKKIRENFGGKLMLMISTPANISEKLIYFFNTIGIPLITTYGLTEASGITHILRTKNSSKFRPNFKKKIHFYDKIGSRGPPIEIPNNPYNNIQQKKFKKNGEFLIKGPMIMKGYWKNSGATAKAIDDHDWLHTGDFAEIDEDGYLFIKAQKSKKIKNPSEKQIDLQIQ